MNDVEIVQEKTAECCVCSKPIAYTSATTPHPQSPELVQVPDGVWFGYIEHVDGGAPEAASADAEHRPIELVFACSDKCRSALLSE